jgi:hypothetical protein
MTDPGIGSAVRHWLHYSNLASSFFRQYNSALKVKKEYETSIINTLLQRNMQHATIQISNGQITVQNRKEPVQLSLTQVEKLINGYYKQRGGKDETKDVMLFIKANRGYNVTNTLKQSNIAPPKISL